VPEVQQVVLVRQGHKEIQVLKELVDLQEQQDLQDQAVPQEHKVLEDHKVQVVQLELKVLRVVVVR
jgi:hypothetical protein